MVLLGLEVSSVQELVENASGSNTVYFDFPDDQLIGCLEGNLHVLDSLISKVDDVTWQRWNQQRTMASDNTAPTGDCTDEQQQQQQQLQGSGQSDIHSNILKYLNSASLAAAGRGTPCVLDDNKSAAVTADNDDTNDASQFKHKELVAPSDGEFISKEARERIIEIIIEPFKEMKQKEKLLELLASKENSCVCTVCGKGFAWRSILEKHMTSQHPDETQTKQEHSEMEQTELEHIENEHVEMEQTELETDESSTMKTVSERIESTVSDGNVSELTNTRATMKPTVTAVTATKSNRRKISKCQICDEEFAESKQLSNHLRIEHKDESSRYECEFCDRRFTRIDHFKLHVMNHTGFRPFICEFCAKGFKTRAELKKHMLKHETSGGPLQCEYCEKTLWRRENMDLHMRTHTGDKLFKCGVCDKLWTTRHALKQHELTHTDHKPFVCEHCGKTCSNKGNLGKHIASMHPPELFIEGVTSESSSGDCSFACDVCGKSFSSLALATRHMERHTAVKKHRCDVCAKSFSSKHTLATHMQLHDGTQPFVCAVCGKGFSRRQQLTEHVMLHTGERPFPCSTCEKRFTTAAKLKVHERVHTGEKPFKCSVCGKAFNRADKLTTHYKQTHKSGVQNAVEMYIAYE
ncbi:uncharacterized protein LOC141910087 [Tubulanus polymorphus]|uniref:uncharacterized protein LOC141910087 n=1 Tax=Tubulanus polymorphus TaxID=672921 RepID=UPI003DA61912